MRVAADGEKVILCATKQTGIEQAVKINAAPGSCPQERCSSGARARGAEAVGRSAGVPGMDIGLEVEVLCGARWRQPRVGGNCTQYPCRMTRTLAPRGRVGKKPEANRSTERKRTPVQAEPAGSACLETRRPKSIRGRSGIGGGSGGTFSEPYPGRSAWVRASGRPEGGDDDGTKPMQKSDLLIVARRPAKAGRAKGEMD
jgi:hypothetical protein